MLAPSDILKRLILDATMLITLEVGSSFLETLLTLIFFLTSIGSAVNWAILPSPLYILITSEESDFICHLSPLLVSINSLVASKACCLETEPI